jgi:hypothetical protein
MNIACVPGEDAVHGSDGDAGRMRLRILPQEEPKPFNSRTSGASVQSSAVHAALW